MRKRYVIPSSALTDIAFLLLLFFLILAITTYRTPVPVDLPEASGSGMSEAGAFPTVLISSSGEMFLDHTQITYEQLPPSEEYVLLADRETPFSLVHPVIEQLKEMGVKRVHCVVQEGT